MGAGEGNSMAEQSKKPPKGADNTDSASLKSLFSDFIWMASAFWVSRQRNKLLALAGALIVVVGATAYMQIRLNSWNRPFYNALTNKDMPGFLPQLWVFGEIAGILLVLNVAQMWLNQSSKVVLRQGLVNDLLDQWLKPKRAFRLSNSGPLGANPDQRLQADAQHLTDLSTDLGDRPSAVEPSSAHVRRRPLGALAGPVSADRGPRLRPARLSRMVRAGLRRALRPT